MSLRTAFFIGSVLALAGCSSSVVTYTAVSSAVDTTKNGELFEATERVLVRRFAGADIENASVTVIPIDETSATTTIKVPSEAVATVERIASDPFTFEIRIADGMTKDSEGNDQVNWKSTGINGRQLNWISPVQGPNPSDIGVELEFTEEGKEKITSLFQENVGTDIGIFVRDLLVSKLKVNTAEAADHIIIGGIPSARIAEIFADDVNVGLHITFTPSL